MHRPESEWSRPQLRLLGTLRPQLRSLGTHRVAAMDQDEGLMAVDNIVTQFNTYEDFLDSQITTIDLYYLEVSARSPDEPRRGSVAPWRRRRGWSSRSFLRRLQESQALQVQVCSTGRRLCDSGSL